MMDTSSRLSGKYSPGVITGKPLIIGGSQGRNGSDSSRLRLYDFGRS